MDEALKPVAVALLANLLLSLADVYGEANMNKAWALAKRARAARPKLPRRPRPYHAHTEHLLKLDLALKLAQPGMTPYARLNWLEDVARQMGLNFEPGSIRRNLSKQRPAYKLAFDATLARQSPEERHRREMMAARLLAEPSTRSNGGT